MKNQLKTILLLGTLTALMVGVGSTLSPGYTWLFLALALLMNLGTYFFSDRIVLRMHGARELDPAHAPALHAMVQELSSRAGIPAPRLFLIEEDQPNAFATGRNPRHGVVALTTGILRLLDRRELRGVIAHEIAHIKNRDILLASIAAAMASVVTHAAHALGFAALFGGGQSDDEGESAGGGLLFALLAPLAAMLVQLGISRSREYAADKTGAEISGDPEALALALLELQRAAEHIPANASPATASLFIVNPLAGVGGSILSLFSTHPSTEQRVARLMQLARSMSPPVRLGRRVPFAVLES